MERNTFGVEKRDSNQLSTEEILEIAQDIYEEELAIFKEKLE